MVTIGDVVIFGKSNAANGEITFGRVRGWSGKNLEIIALEERGRPKKGIGTLWTCHPSTILQVIDNHRTPQEDAPMLAHMIRIGNVIKTKYKADRKDRITAWKDNMPTEWNKEYYWYNEEHIVKCNKLNQKSVGCDLYHMRDGNWKFRQKWKFSGKWAVNHLVSRKGTSMKYNGNPLDPDNPYQDYPLSK